jgi:hypothetical protein
MTTLARHRAASTASHLRSIANGDLTVPQVITQKLTDALTADDYSGCIKDLPSINIEPQAYIDGLDKVRFRSFFIISGRSPFTASGGLRLLISFQPNPIFMNDAFER